MYSALRYSKRVALIDLRDSRAASKQMPQEEKPQALLYNGPPRLVKKDKKDGVLPLTADLSEVCAALQVESGLPHDTAVTGHDLYDELVTEVHRRMH